MSGNRTLNSEAISEIAAKKRELTGQDRPLKAGPTAQAQKHANQLITATVVSDITQGEKNVTGRNIPISGGPGALAQSMASSRSYPVPERTHTGMFDAHIILAIAKAEWERAGANGSVAGGPISTKTLLDIIQGEKKLTGGGRPRPRRASWGKAAALD